MVSNRVRGYFKWYLNNSNSLSTVYISSHNAYQSGSGMVTVELAVGDTVSLKSMTNKIIVDGVTCYTLIKIKWICVSLYNCVNIIIYKEQKWYVVIILF
jgi:hypothetical protein